VFLLSKRRSLDIRQNSKIHDGVLKMFRHCIKSNLSVFPENYYDLTEDEKFEVLSNVKGNIDPNDFENEITKSTIESIKR
jgi:phosphoenolpyruvate carboxylase